MIKINVILSNPTWKKYIKSPNNFINNKIFLINKKEKFYKKKNLHVPYYYLEQKKFKN